MIIEALVKHPRIDVFFPRPVRPSESSSPGYQPRLDETEPLPNSYNQTSAKVRDERASDEPKEKNSPNARHVVHIHQVEHARLVPQPRCVIQIRPREDAAVAAVSMGRRDDESRVADLDTKRRDASGAGQYAFRFRMTTRMHGEQGFHSFMHPFGDSSFPPPVEDAGSGNGGRKDGEWSGWHKGTKGNKGSESATAKRHEGSCIMIVFVCRDGAV